MSVDVFNFKIGDKVRCCYESGSIKSSFIPEKGTIGVVKKICTDASGKMYEVAVKWPKESVSPGGVIEGEEYCWFINPEHIEQFSSKFKVGDKVRYIGIDTCSSMFYPPFGTIGIIKIPEDECGDVVVQWPAGTTEKRGLLPTAPYSWAVNIVQIEKVDKNRENEEENMSNKEIAAMLESKFNKNELKNTEDLIGTAYRCGYLRAKKGRPFKYEEKNNVNKKKNNSEKDCNCEGNNKCGCESGCCSKEKFIVINNKKIWYDDDPDKRFEFGDKIVFIEDSEYDSPVWPKQGTMGIFLEECHFGVGDFSGGFWALWENYAEVGKEVNEKRYCWYEYCRKVIRVEDI